LDEAGLGDRLGEPERFLVVDVCGFESVDLEEDGLVPDAVAALFEGLLLKM